MKFYYALLYYLFFYYEKLLLIFFLIVQPRLAVLFLFCVCKGIMKCDIMQIILQDKSRTKVLNSQIALKQGVLRGGVFADFFSFLQIICLSYVNFMKILRSKNISFQKNLGKISVCRKIFFAWKKQFRRRQIFPDFQIVVHAVGRRKSIARFSTLQILF